MKVRVLDAAIAAAAVMVAGGCSSGPAANAHPSVTPAAKPGQQGRR